MAWTNGFFNSVNGDRKYNANQLSRIFEGLITDGVYESVGNKLAVQPNSGMTIQINTGRGWFGGHWVNNDSEYLVTLENPDVLLKRYCAVCIRVDETLENRSVLPVLKYSEFATSPVKPTMTRTETVKEYCLAYVLINAAATEITAADIEDCRGNTDLCGWVTGLIEQVDTKTLWEQWQAQWSNYMTDKSAAFDAWQLQEQTDFLEWYNNLQTNLDGNVAATLTSKVAILENDVSALETRAVRSSGTFNGLGWTNQGNGYYTQSVSIPGVTATNDVIISPSIEFKDAYMQMRCEAYEQGAGTILFRCQNPDDVDMTVEAIIFNF